MQRPLYLWRDRVPREFIKFNRSEYYYRTYNNEHSKRFCSYHSLHIHNCKTQQYCTILYSFLSFIANTSLSTQNTKCTYLQIYKCDKKNYIRTR